MGIEWEMKGKSIDVFAEKEERIDIKVTMSPQVEVENTVKK